MLRALHAGVDELASGAPHARSIVVICGRFSFQSFEGGRTRFGRVLSPGGRGLSSCVTHSTFEVYGANSTHRRDNLLLATVRLLAGWPKMPGERDCYARFVKEWAN